MSKGGSLRKIIPGILLGGFIAMSAVGCVGPKIGPAIPDSGWDTSYSDALSPHTQLALGVLESLKSDPASVPNKGAVLGEWKTLAQLIDQKASVDQINAARRQVEGALGQGMVDKIKAKHYSKSDLMGFMLSSGMKIPAGGVGSLNPDLIAAQKVTESLQAGGVKVAKVYDIKAVPPEEALSPIENLLLGTALLLERERDSFEMSQIFRLALYTRPVRRVYDPNPLLVKVNDRRIETVYLDRIYRVLKPEQVMKIRDWNLTRKDLIAYLERHVKLPGLDWRDDTTFSLVEYVVNDFHEQIAPATTIKAEDKPDYYIPESLLKISGKNPGDGQKLYEGICAACHGVDGQGRFPPIALKSYLTLHSDHEHAAIVQEGPPQKPGAPVVMPTFKKYLNDDQVWAIVKHVRSWEKSDFERRGEKEARAAKVKFYDTADVYEMWKAQKKNVFFLDVQSDIAFRIMGHIKGATHIRPEELDQKMKEFPKDKEILVIDMFGSQGLPVATQLAKNGFRTSYMGPGMVDWHINRNYPVAYN